MVRINENMALRFYKAQLINVYFPSFLHIQMECADAMKIESIVDDDFSKKNSRVCREFEILGVKVCTPFWGLEGTSEAPLGRAPQPTSFR